MLVHDKLHMQEMTEICGKCPNVHTNRQKCVLRNVITIGYITQTFFIFIDRTNYCLWEK